jgi:hypothetical protein
MKMYQLDTVVTNPTYVMSFDTLKLFGQGALGAMTFGMYHQYTTNKLMELNNQQMKQEYNSEINIIKEQHKKDIEQHKKDIEQLMIKIDNQTKWFWQK